MALKSTSEKNIIFGYLHLLFGGVLTMKAHVSFRIEKELWKKFIEKYKGKGSERIREMIRTDLEMSNECPKIQRDNIEMLKSIIFSNGAPVQVVGNVGVGKTTTIKKLIQSDKDHVYIVFDCHDEYELPEIQTITTDLTQSCRVKMPKQVSASRGLFPVYHNQILSQRYPENYVIVIEEAHRYREIKELLKEARKFVKIIAICQEPLGSFCPKVEIVK